MHQDPLDNQVKKIFGSMSDQDRVESLSRKEDIWQTINADNGKKRSKQWLLFILLSSLFFAAGWILRNYNITQNKSPQIDQIDKVQPNQVNQFALAKMETQLSFKESQIDSLLEANRVLLRRFDGLNDKTTAINTVYVRDTLYITEVKIEQQTVEKYIRDTVLIEVPLVAELQPIMAEAKMESLENSKENDPNADLAKKPSSIQFNFSELKPKGK